MRLNKRLAAACDLVRSGARVCDVGTDHAHLPIRLVSSGKSPFAIACDIGKGPLENARENVARARLEDRIDLRLCDGLSSVLADEVDDVVIAGMGGDLIARIIDRAEWLRDKDKRLILQPMTSADELRGFLAVSGFEIVTEHAVYDARRLYTVMLVQYNGAPVDTPPEYIYIGGMKPDSEAGRDYYRRQVARLRRHADELLNAAEDHPERCALLKIADSIEKML